MCCSVDCDCNASATLLEVREVFRDFATGPNKVRALSPVSLQVARGDFVVVRGPSGSGKSTLLSLMSGMDRPSGGAVYFREEPLQSLNETALAKTRNKHFGFIFQSAHVLYDRTVAENVALPARYSQSLTLKGATERSHQLLDYVGLSDLADRFPNTLSGGELQRVAFARALLCDPEIIFADEPTGSLDGENSRRLLDLLQDQIALKRTVVMVTHDEQAMTYGSRIINLDKFEQESTAVHAA